MFGDFCILLACVGVVDLFCRPLPLLRFRTALTSVCPLLKYLAPALPWIPWRWQCRELAFWNITLVCAYNGKHDDSQAMFEKIRIARRDRLAAERTMRRLQNGVDAVTSSTPLALSVMLSPTADEGSRVLGWSDLLSASKAHVRVRHGVLPCGHSWVAVAL